MYMYVEQTYQDDQECLSDSNLNFHGLEKLSIVLHLVSTEQQLMDEQDESNSKEESIIFRTFSGVNVSPRDKQWLQRYEVVILPTRSRKNSSSWGGGVVVGIKSCIPDTGLQISHPYIFFKGF